MFSTHARLRQRQGRHGTSRAQFVQDLVSRLQALDSDDDAGRAPSSRAQAGARLAEREGALATLANLAYDPINFEYLRRLNAFELFLDCVAEGLEEQEGGDGRGEGAENGRNTTTEAKSDHERTTKGEEEGGGKERLAELALAGLCNAAADPANGAAILALDDAVPLLAAALRSPVTGTVLSAMGCLYFLCTPATRRQVLTPEVTSAIDAFAASPHPRFRNLATAFLHQHVGPH